MPGQGTPITTGTAMDMARAMIIRKMIRMLMPTIIPTAMPMVIRMVTATYRPTTAGHLSLRCCSIPDLSSSK